MSEESNGADISAEIAGQKVDVKNIKSLNTVVTLFTFVGVCILVYAFYLHRGDGLQAATSAKEDRQAFVKAVQEQTQAIREGNAELRLQNCLSKFPENQRAAQDAWCKQISGAR